MPASVPATASPWRRRTESLEAKSLSVQAAEFVPSWQKAEEALPTPSTQGLCGVISLGAYSDSSEDEKQVASDVTPLVKRPWRTSVTEFVPQSLDSAAKAPVEGFGHNHVEGAAEKSYMWHQKDAPAFVPSWKKEQEVLAPATCQATSCFNFGAYSDDSSDEESCDAITPSTAPAVVTADQPIETTPLARRPWRVVPQVDAVTEEAAPEVKQPLAAKASPWRRVAPNSPTAESEDFPVLGAAKNAKTNAPSFPSPEGTSEKLMPLVSSATLSTSEGSASDENLSTDSGSRSQSPPPMSPRAEQEKQATPLGMLSLLQWRHATASERPAGLLVSSAKPEAGTPEEAVAAFVAEAAAEGEVEQVKPAEHKRPVDCTSPPKQSAATPAATQSWRKLVVATPVAQEEKMWRSVEPVKKLEVSQDSWAARQRDRRKSQLGSETDTMSDEDVARAMKSILNKLTVEKFESLSVQLVHCGIRSRLHLETLIHEVFEKATTQHHFINMYADLCVLLSQEDIIDDSKKTFKKILLGSCQASFEKHLTPPSSLAELTGEDHTNAEVMYKMRMLGNIRFVGALFVRKMLASKVMLAIMEVLLQDPTPEALESLAAFLMVVGPTFDVADWAYYSTLNAVFAQVDALAKKKSVSKRVRCLLKDVSDIRKAGWLDRRPKKIEGPVKLKQVADQAAMEGGETPKASTNADDWATVGGTDRGKLASPIATKPSLPCAPEPAANQKRNSLFEKARARQESSKQEVVQEVKKEKVAKFDKEACRAEMSATLAELRVSHDVPDAAARVATIAVPVSHQASELDKMLACIVEEGSQDTRKICFGLVVELFIKNHWKAESVGKGIRRFVEETCVDLKCDVPTLPKILRDELYPALAALMTSNLLDVEQHNSLLSV